MELNKIEHLLEKYFDAETTLAEEQQLKAYFMDDGVAPHLEQYRSLFGYFREQATETFNKPLPLVETNAGNKRKWLSVAASMVLLAGMATWFGVLDGKQQPTAELGTYDDPEVAFMETQKALNMLSKKVNVGVEGMSYIGEYENTRKSIFKE